MFKKLLLILALISIVILTGYGALSGTYTTNSIFYRPGYGSYGLEEYNAYNAAMEVADNAIKDNQVAFGSYYLKTEIDTLSEVETIYTKDITDSDELASALTSYYLKTAIDTLGEVETIYVKDIIDSDELAALKFTDLADTPANYTDQAGKYVKVNAGETDLEFGTPAGYTNLTSFVDQTAWRVFYSNTDGDVVELALGTDGQYLKSTGATSAPIFDTPIGAGESNTASNIGSEVEIFKQKTGVDLEFRTLKANSNKIIVTNSPDANVDIGSPAIYRADGNSANYTIIDRNNPANESGFITSIEIWANTSMTGCKVATFFLVSGNNYSTRDSQAIGNVTAGSKQTFPVNLIVQAGDYIGIYFGTGALGRTYNAGAQIAFLKSGDYIPCENITFTQGSTNFYSLYGTGITGYLDYIIFDVVPSEIAKEIGGLLSTTTVSFAADADTTLYTVPTGRRCVLSHAIVVAAGDAGATTTLSIGQDTAETDFVPANTLSNLDAQYDSVILQPIPNTTPLKNKSYAAATVIQAQVASQSGVAGNTIYLFGITY